MSYILDALKKSSEERRKLQEAEEQHSALPLVSNPAQQPRRRYRVPALLALVTICSFTIGWWWYSSEKTTDENSAALTTPQLSQGTNQPESAASPQSSPPEGTNIAQQAPPDETVPPEQQPAMETKDPLKVEAPTVETVMPRQEELPIAIRSQIPEMKFSGHVFSENPELRMILINTDIAREGAQIDADLKLLEITESGLIMSFKGTDFTVDLF